MKHFNSIFSSGLQFLGDGCDGENAIPEVAYSAEWEIANQLPSESSITHQNRCDK
jgi:hypothetical protein